MGIGVATGAYGLSFGAISVASGLDVWQTQFLSLGMFTGASQFALVGILGTGGGALVAIVTALLLGARNSLYALSLRSAVTTPRQPSIVRTLGPAPLTSHEWTQLATSYPEGSPQARHAFWATGIAIYVLWNLGTLIGALGAAALDDPRTLGLDAAEADGFIAQLLPRLRGKSTIALAMVRAPVAVALVPVLRPGLPVLSAVLVALVAERFMARRRA